MSDRPQQAPEDDRPAGTDSHALPLDRFNAFSDAVFAIAITLLVLEISVPQEGVALWPALREQWPEFLGYYISFAFIGGIWITHSGVTRYMRRGDTVIYTLNLVLLLLVGLLPFATSLMVTHLTGTDAKLAALIYGMDLLLASLVLSLLIIYLAREPALLVNDLDEDILRRVTRQRWTSIGLNALAVALAVFSAQLAVALYLVVSTVLLIVPLLGMRRHRQQRRAG
jgi:uncharacterized membrane protein